MQIQILDNRLTQDAFIPATPGSIGIDLSACIDEPIKLYPGDTTLVSAGFKMALPDGYGAFIMPRSGRGHKDGIVMGNLIGVIDIDYRGKVHLSLWNRNDVGEPYVVEPMAAMAQMIIMPVLSTQEWCKNHIDFVDSLNETVRGEGGFGHTDRKN